MQKGYVMRGERCVHVRRYSVWVQGAQVHGCMGARVHGCMGALGVAVYRVGGTRAGSSWWID